MSRAWLFWLIAWAIVIALLLCAWAVETFISQRFFKAMGWGSICGAVAFMILLAIVFHSSFL